MKRHSIRTPKKHRAKAGVVVDRQYLELLDEHYRRNWGSPLKSLNWRRGPVHELPRDFGLVGFSRRSGNFTLATRGLGSIEQRPKSELFMIGPDDPQVIKSTVELLTIVAHYHFTEATLDVGHIVNFGRPWVANSPCTRGLVSLPYLDGPSLEHLPENHGRILWVIPVTEEEREFANSEGLEALERRFEAATFEYWNPYRSSVV